MSKQCNGKIRKVELKSLPIELYKILKFANMVQSGGEAKYVIGKGLVSLNSEVETRKGKKVLPGDMIEFGGEKIQIALNEKDIDTVQKE